MRKKWIAGILSAVLIISTFAPTARAAFETNLEAAYNTAVQGQDALDGLDVTVKEKTISANTNLSASKEVSLRVSGIKNSLMKADIQVTTDEGSTVSYYRGDAYYAETSEGKIRREMERADIWQMINSHIYLDMTSNYLKMLYSETAADGSVIYTFVATGESLGDYAKKLLAGSGEGQGLVIDSLQGTMETDADGHVQKRTIQMVYTVNGGDSAETFLVNSEAVFHQNGESVTVALPDLSEYKSLETEKPAETITPLVQTLYTTEDVNVRAAGDLNAVILGGLYAGCGVTQTGYTSDGWIQIQYNGATGYIWGEYTSTKMPVLTKTSSGTMYATAGVNIRAGYSSDHAVIGVLEKGEGIEITGTTSNGWIRVKYNGNTGYIFADYLSWSEPVADTYVENGYVSGTVTDASFGALVIRKDDGQGTAAFNTTYARMNLKDTIATGDWVEIWYYGAGAPYTASQVNDYTRHSDMEDEKSVTVEGVITKLMPDEMELTGSDGIYRTFDISNCDFEMAEDLYEGKYVMVTWMSRTNGTETRNIQAMRVKGD